MRQRASTKTQRRLKQQQLRDPYALTGDVHSEAPTFRVGGLVTAVGVLQLVVAMALGGFVFGGALLFCAMLLTAVGLLLLLHSDPKASKQGLGLKQAVSRLLALRRSALDYSLTLSIAQSQEYQQQTQRKELQIAVVPSSPTPQKVVTAMALKQKKTAKARKPTPLVSNAPLATLNRVNMKPLSTINSSSVDAAEELFVEKPRANSEPKQVLRSRPLVPLKPKMQQLGPVQEKKTHEKMAPALPKTLGKQEKKAQQAMQVKTQPMPQPQQLRKKPEPKAPKVAAKKEIQLPAVFYKSEPKVVIPAVLPKAEPVAELPKPKLVEVAPPAATVAVEPVAPVVAPLPVFPVVKPLVDVARGEPAMERELVVTRKVLLYLSPGGESMVDLEEQELEQDIEKEQELEVELEHELEAFDEAFPPLSPTMIPQVPMPLPAVDAMEPNFLMDIELEPISKPEKKLISLSSLRLKPAGNSDLRAMLDDMDVMRLELDAAMARCTSLLNGDEEKLSAPSSPELEPEEEPIFCC
ncbi:hypothetical protein PHYPSEUDO_000276 [Phytophthora pseudosyringae]|uniref:Uncharacterized protein n=1 Tax=Phytophthora pseudosyringae TaxID=221518 RepID=A0A8T1VYH9_9STRA|nr:hypothetical protein PHYPSEUDO_000276 [Phytophthora pseudosyringae]